MPTQEDVQYQQALLDTHRKNLRRYLLQKASIGASYVPPAIANGIDEERKAIARIKSNLRGWDISVADHPDDRESTTTFYTNNSSSSLQRNTKITTTQSEKQAQNSIDIWKAVFHDITHSRLVYERKYLDKWIILTTIGFGISLLVSFGLYLSSGPHVPTLKIPNPLERLFLNISLIPSFFCGVMQYAYIAKINIWLWVWIPINLILISLLKGLTVWPFGFTLEMLLVYIPVMYLFQISLGLVFKGIVILIKYVNS